VSFINQYLKGKGGADASILSLRVPSRPIRGEKILEDLLGDFHPPLYDFPGAGLQASGPRKSQIEAW
jgi:hypothetical protein